MQLTRRTLLSSIGAAGVSLAFIGTATAASGHRQYLVAGQGNGIVNRLESAGFEVTASLAGGRIHRVLGPADADPGAVNGVDAAAADARFAVSVPEAVATVEDDASVEQAGPAFLENQWDKQVTNALEAHEVATGAGSSVAVIDTGVDVGHPDLVDNLNVEDTTVITSLDALDPFPDDLDGHGTNVAGIAAASGAAGVVGTAPDAEIVGIKVFVAVEDDEGNVVLQTTTGDILEAIDYAAGLGVDAANLSLGTDPIPPEANADQIRVIYEQVIQHATREGTVVVASAGNSAANLQQGGFFTVPNSTAGAMSISSSAPDDGLSYYSNFGTNEIDVGAPGGAYDNLADTSVGYAEWIAAGQPALITQDPREPNTNGTLWLDADGVPTTDPAAAVDDEPHPIPDWPVPFNFVFNAVNDGGYGWYAGTSMAAPQVAGLVALVRELDPDANANQVESAIAHGADGPNGRGDAAFGAGRLDALATVDRLG